MRYYEYRHVIAFQETNLVGNVYFTHYLDWQGRCRELFLRDHAPDLLDQLNQDFSLATVRCSCEYFAELRAFEEVKVRMRLAELVQNRLTLAFEYWVLQAGGEHLIARGEQQVACMKHQNGKLTPAAVPASLRAALATYA